MNVETIWKEYQQSLKAFLHKKIANPDDVEDLLQEVLIKTYHNLATVHDTKKIKSWLFQIANHTIIDFYRKRGRNLELHSEDLWFEEQEISLTSELAQCVTPFIEGLPEQDARLLKAIEIEGLSQKEFAEREGIKYSTLKSRVQKSRQKLYGVFNKCCEFSIDSQGNVMDYQKRESGCGCS
ncbi:RNA polymerase sigma factor SigZ [Vibrio astriarenae]|uniref:RNA polymerase sigma factor n=1 Tax=Vibrio astriarenae TaxID=1481923 RepID=A0A7Z2YGF8_9VIBR|nr:RNA polymerase sigma factor SigZ [Vibrio astriarenae]QIA66184.1 RNA polymerase sigma factor SigZ [Vibrio astriarenae]